MGVATLRSSPEVEAEVIKRNASNRYKRSYMGGEGTGVAEILIIN